jgi:hypothetical protein
LDSRSKVDECWIAVRSHYDVVRFYIAVQKASLMQLGQPLAKRRYNSFNFLFGQ